MPGSEYAALLAHAGGVLYGTELGSVTLKRIGFFCFPIKHSTHTHFGPEPTQVLNLVISVLLCQEPATWGGLDLGSAGVWDRDYGWGVRVLRPFGARRRSSVRYGTWLGDLKENWFLLFSN